MWFLTLLMKEKEGWTIEGPDSQIRTLTTGETILNGQEGR